MYDNYVFASSILGGVLLSLLIAYAACVKSTFLKISGERFTSGAGAICTIFKRQTVNYSGKPLTRAQVAGTFPEGTWQYEAYNDFRNVLLDEGLEFPCIYAIKGFKTDDQLYMFIDSDDLSDPRHIQSLATALTAYLAQARDLGPNTSLVLLGKKMPQTRTVEEYNGLFWELLNGLAKLDAEPWPVHTPRDIDTDRWCFCFNGEPFFTVVQTPAHQIRRSRYAPGITIVYQPKWIFEVLFSTDAKRAAAVAKVHARIRKYDPIPLSPELKNYGTPGSRESTQYFLLDNNMAALCPLDRLSDSKACKA